MHLVRSPLMLTKLFSVFVFCHTLLAACGPPRDRDRGEPIDATDEYAVQQIGKIGRHEMEESSGLALADPAAQSFWTHGDGGSPNVLYRISRTGELLQEQQVNGASNTDWEDLARDPTGRLFIGDFGNNQNARRDLKVYVFDPAQPGRVDTIRFHYPDQHEFPPRKPGRNFDCEAFYFDHDVLHLFTKNRAKNGLLVKEYTLPARPGTYTATLVDSLRLETWVTAADLSPDGRTVALLGYGFVYLFEGEPGQRVFDRKRRRLQMASTGQAEGLTFINNTDFVFSNEHGKLFEAKKIDH